jgi:hypothetical protein
MTETEIARTGTCLPAPAAEAHGRTEALGRTNARGRRAAAAIVIACLASPAAAADDPILAKLAGDWIGRGIFRQTAEATIEHIYCKITNTLLDGGGSLLQKGRCAIASNSAALEITITAAGAGRYTGSGGGLGIASRGQATLKGTGTASHIDLVADLIDTQTQKTARATATIELMADGYRIRTRATDDKTGETFTTGELVFTAH